LGFEVTRQGNLVNDESGTLSEWFDIPDDAQVRFAFLQSGTGTIELLEARAHGQRTESARNWDYAGRHLALQTDDLAAFAQRNTRLAAFAQRNTRLEDGLARVRAVPGAQVFKLKDGRFAYVRTPFGMYLQLMAP
jgi:hypothetical protein